MPTTIVIFGASGDLTSRKLVPALYNLMRAGTLPAETRIVGFSRTPHSDAEWRASLRESTARHAGGGPLDEAVWNRFADTCFYQRMNETPHRLKSVHLQNERILLVREPVEPAKAASDGLPRRRALSRPGGRGAVA